MIVYFQNSTTKGMEMTENRPRKEMFTIRLRNLTKGKITGGYPTFNKMIREICKLTNR